MPHSAIALFAIVVALQGGYCESEPIGTAGETRQAAYEALLDDAEVALTAANWDALRAYVERLSCVRLHEIPTYEWRVFQAAVMLHEGNSNAAQAELDAFEDMLRIDGGVWSCDKSTGYISRNGRLRESPLAYAQMCGEIYRPYYEDPTRGTLRNTVRFWSLSAQVRESMRLAD